MKRTAKSLETVCIHTHSRISTKRNVDNKGHPNFN